MKLKKLQLLVRAISAQDNTFRYGGGIEEFESDKKHFAWLSRNPYGIYLVLKESASLYVGKDDSKGVHIFEGDVIEVMTEFEGETFIERFVVGYDSNVCAFCAFDEKGYPYEGFMDFGGSSTVTVIGNVYQNPELVEGWSDPKDISL